MKMPDLPGKRFRPLTDLPLQAEALSVEGFKTNQNRLKDVICARLGIAAAPGAIPQNEWDEIYSNPAMTYRFLRLYTYKISYGQCYVRSPYPLYANKPDLHLITFQPSTRQE